MENRRIKEKKNRQKFEHNLPRAYLQYVTTKSKENLTICNGMNGRHNIIMHNN